MRRSAILTAAALAALASCRPPASDRYVERIELGGAAEGPAVMMQSPQVEGAIWAGSGGPERIVFGQPGQAPLLALECTGDGPQRMLSVTRFARTDPHAKGMMALVGNGHVERLMIDAHDAGRGWLWQGHYTPADPRLDALTGTRKLELTIPGAGTLVLQGSGKPGELIERCRRLDSPEASGQPSALEPLVEPSPQLPAPQTPSPVPPPG
ncbi:hypothetical protein [Tsuneonella amylolytica]|uniref:hypothetical protein n=1 Tax=Tsuneonella amylolytica TaxID=2338327 RepID=UPI000EAA52AA|nr:hypothetical protein [Tsuneonella amylolytica]